MPASAQSSSVLNRSDRDERAPGRAWRPVALRLLPYALAAFFALWALRGAGYNNVVDTDAARHAMNGVFLRDLVAGGPLMHPIEFGRQYYAHLPALSMPYHPPMFPMLEAVFFLLFGVNVLTARILIALSVAVSAWLLYRLVNRTSGSAVVAACTVITFFSLRDVQSVASDVMLEMPTLAFTLGAMYCLRDIDREFSLWRGIGFALLAGCAVWTKQQSVFLGLTPFLFVVLAWRWRLLLGKTIWISAFLFAGAVIGYTLLTLPFHGAGVDQATRPQWFSQIFAHNLNFYARSLRSVLGLVPLAGILAALVVALFLRKARLTLYVAWAVSAFFVLLLIGPYDRRYLFFTYPALFAAGYGVLEMACSRALGESRRSWIPAAVASVCLVSGSLVPATFMTGPAEVAAAMIDGSPKRVLYCGTTDGSFIFETRRRDPNLRTIVITGDKLPASTFSPEKLEQFASRYGVSYVVIEKATRPQVWDNLGAHPTPSMVLEHMVPLASSNARWNGSLAIYRFTRPSATPASTLELPLSRIGGHIDARF